MLEPEELFPSSVVGTCEDGGHACVGPLGGCEHLLSQSPLNPAVFHRVVQEGPEAKQQGLSQRGKLRYGTP